MNGRPSLDSGASHPPRFPLRVGVVDIGSNAIRFTAAEFLGAGARQDLERQRVPVRLGRSAFLTGRLLDTSVQAAVEALASFRRRGETLGVTEFRAVATSAVRESRNGNVLVERARRESGVEIETITGSGEARLIWMAVRERVPPDARWMMMDLGGGSLEIAVATDGSIEWSESHTMGTVRIIDELGQDPETVDGLRSLHRLLEEYAATLRVAVPDGPQPQGIMATGGNIEELAALADCPPDADAISRLPLRRLREVTDRLASMTRQQRIDECGLRPDRADVIVPAGLIYHRVAAVAGFDSIVVPHVGLTDGLLLDVVQSATAERSRRDREDRAIREAATALGRKFQFDEPHAHHVVYLALALFDQLESLHALQPRDRRVLLAAALVHDVGQFLSFRKHHKHSFYLVRHSELGVFSPREVLLVALVARYHRRAHPRPDHEGWCDLDESERSRVARLAALLRVADALDREHLQRVRSVEPEQDGEELLLHVDASGDLLLEQWALEKKGEAFFSEVFGLRPRMVLEGRKR